MTDETLTTPQIFTFRGQPVIRDADLAALFSYTTGNLNKLVNNNAERFGEDFAFRLDEDEFVDLKFQLGISKAHGRSISFFHPPNSPYSGVLARVRGERDYQISQSLPNS